MPYADLGTDGLRHPNGSRLLRIRLSNTLAVKLWALWGFDLLSASLLLREVDSECCLSWLSSLNSMPFLSLFLFTVLEVLVIMRTHHLRLHA
jgi:hypothetical protein